MADAMLDEPDRVAELAAVGLPLLVAHGEADDAWLPHVQADMAAAARRPARGHPQLDPLPRRREPAADAGGAARLLGGRLVPRHDPAAVATGPPRRTCSGSSARTASRWRVHSDPSFSVGGLRALLLQALHPVAMDGVARFSGGFRDEPWPRLIRTATYVDTLTFGTRTEAVEAVARVRGIHRRLGATEETTGRAYRVDDPDLLLWVHCCEVDSLLTVARRAGLPLTDEDADRYVAEQVTSAELIGIPRRRRPGVGGRARGVLRGACGRRSPSRRPPGTPTG